MRRRGHTRSGAGCERELARTGRRLSRGHAQRQRRAEAGSSALRPVLRAGSRAAAGKPPQCGEQQSRVPQRPQGGSREARAAVGARTHACKGEPRRVQQDTRSARAAREWPSGRSRGVAATRTEATGNPVEAEGGGGGGDCGGQATLASCAGATGGMGRRAVEEAKVGISTTDLHFESPPDRCSFVRSACRACQLLARLLRISAVHCECDGGRRSACCLWRQGGRHDACPRRLHVRPRLHLGSAAAARGVWLASVPLHWQPSSWSAAVRCRLVLLSGRTAAHCRRARWAARVANERGAAPALLRRAAAVAASCRVVWEQPRSLPASGCPAAVKLAARRQTSDCPAAPLAKWRDPSLPGLGTHALTRACARQAGSGPLAADKRSVPWEGCVRPFAFF